MAWHCRANVDWPPEATCLPAPSLTVIVACYNLAALLPACLQSLFAQPGADRIRVIVVDDGSTDGSLQAAHAVVASHPGIDCAIVSQPNQGAGGAKNTGLSHTTTDYVTFVDGDDLVSSRYLAALLPRVAARRADIIAFHATIVDFAGAARRQLRVHAQPCTDNRFSRRELADDAAALGEWQPCLRVFRTRLFQGTRFPPSRYYEDAAVVPALYARASVIENLDEALYLYRQRPGSLTSAITEKHVDDLLLNIREAGARDVPPSRYWRTVRTRMLMQAAREIGRAPRSLRPALATRSWQQVQLESALLFQGAWWLRLLDSSLRTEVKELLRRRVPASLSAT